MPDNLTLPGNPFAQPAQPPANPAFSFDPGQLQAVPQPPPVQPQIGPGWMQPPPAPTAAAPMSLPPGAVPPGNNPPLPVPEQPPAVPPGKNPGLPAHGGSAPAQDDLENGIVKAGQREEAAIDTSADATKDAADKLAGVYGDLRVQQQADAQELADKQQRNAELSQELDRQDAANIKAARDYVVPDFWSNSKGLQVASIVSMAMGSIAQGVLGGPNGAADLINKKTDEYFQGQKQKVDNLYRYAEQQGQLDDKTRLRYAKELLDLKDQHAAVQQSILTHISEVEKANAGNVAKADTEALKAKLQQNILKERGESRVQRVNVLKAHSEIAKNYAEAEKARQEGNVAGTLKLTEQDERAYKTYVQPHVRKSDELNRRLNALNSADAGAKNPNASYGEVISALETGISADSGAGVKGVSMGQLHSIIPNLVSAEGKISNAVSMGWDGKVGNEFRAATLRFIERAKQERAAEAKINHGDVMREMASTPYGRSQPDFAQRAADRLYPTVTRSAATVPDPNSEARAWANANPKDPRAAQILKRIGQ